MTEDAWLYAVRRAGRLEDYPGAESYIAAICKEAGVKVQFGLKPMPAPVSLVSREPGSDDA